MAKNLVKLFILASTFLYTHSAQCGQCQSLSLNFAPDSLAPELKNLQKALELLEQSIQSKDSRLFSSLLHPAIHKPENEKRRILESSLLEFEIHKSKLIRNKIYVLDFKKDRELKTRCDDGDLQGLVGPNTQAVVFYSFFKRNEQYRLTANFSPVMVPQQQEHASVPNLGLALFHIQAISYNGKNAERLLNEAERAFQNHSALSAWLLTEAAVRLESSHPYWTSSALEGMKVTSRNYRKILADRLLNLDFRSSLQKATSNWIFEDITVVFQAEGIVPGLKLRNVYDDSLNTQIRKCQQVGATFKSHVSSTGDDIQGVECMIYDKEQDLTQPPKYGSQFIKF